MKWFAILVLASACVAAEKPSAIFTIGGVIVDAATRKPARRVRVVLAPSDRPMSEIAASVTGDDGRFQFTVLQGKYQLRAERAGLPPESFGSNALYGGFGIAVVAGVGRKTDNLEFLLHPPSAVTGKIIDEANEPVENALVQLLRSSLVAGRRTTSMFGWRYTDDLGEYRFGNLPAGSYYLAVTGKPWYAASVQPQTAYAATYYPNTADPRAAAPLLVNPGQEAIANFTLYPSSGYNVTIRCEGECGANLRMNLTGEGIQGTDRFQRVVNFTRSTVIPAVPPGRYVVRVQTIDADKPLSGMATADVGSSDVEIKVDVKEAAKVTGTVVIEDDDPKIASRLVVTLRSESANYVFSDNVTAAGTFQITGVRPGKYRVWIVGVPGVFVKQFRSDDKPLQDGVIDIAIDAGTPIKLIAGKAAGRVKGFVNRNGQSAPGVLVLLVLATLPADPGYYRAFVSDSDGSFDIQHVRPGDYRLFTVADTEFEFANPEAVRPYLAHAKAIRVEAQSLIEEKLEHQ